MDKFVVRIRKVPKPEEPPSTSSSPQLTTGQQNQLENVTSPNSAVDKKGRNFQSKWQTIFPWLVYDGDGDIDKVFCQICKETTSNGVSVPKKSSRDDESIKAFTQIGFSSWNKAIERFKKHEKSDVHRFCVLHKTNLERGVNVHSMLSKSSLEDMKTARTALLKMISSLRFLMTGGLAIRGHDDEHSNYTRLLKLRSQDIPELNSWLQRSKYRWLSHDVTNELCALLCHEVLRKIIKLVQNAVYYSVMVDETRDISNHEQVTFCFRYVDSKLNIHETFFGLYKTTSTTSENLFEIFNDVLRRFNINIKTCRGLCTDGAANVSGVHTGLQSRLKAIEPRAIHVHCTAHSLSLVVQDTMKEVPAIRDFLVLIRELIGFVRSSPKRQACFESLQAADNTQNPSLRPFCPTRWCCRISSLKTILNNYSVLMRFLNDTKNQKDEAGAKSKGFLKSLQSFESLFIIKLLIEVLDRIETLNATLQKISLHLQTVANNINTVKQIIATQRTDEKFQVVWKSAVDLAHTLELDEPKTPKIRRKPIKIDDSSNEPHQFSSPAEFYRKIYFEVIDKVVGSIEQRFTKNAMTHLSNMEIFLTEQNDISSNASNYVKEFYGDDFDIDRLVLHRNMLLDIAKTKNVTLDNIEDVVSFINSHSESTKEMISEVIKFLKIVLTIPVSTCTAERSFSALRRIKTYLRSTMTQQRLNDHMVVHVNGEMADDLDLEEIADTFITRSVVRQNTFTMKRN